VQKFPGNKKQNRLDAGNRTDTNQRGLSDWMPLLLNAAFRNKDTRGTRLPERELFLAVRGIKTLSHGFTRERELAGDRYMGNEELLAAYLLYYWPVSYMQTRLVFERLLPACKIEGASVLELGSGPAPGLFALLDMGAKQGVAADSVRAATSLAARLAEDFKGKKQNGYNFRAAFWDGVKGTAVPAGKYDIMLMSHVLNELWSGRPDRIQLRRELLLRVMDSLSDSGMLVIIEPALLQVTRDLLLIQKGLLGEGCYIHSPCVVQESCPCLHEESATCHADLEWSPPLIVEQLAHKARIGRESLKFSFLAVSRTAAAGNAAVTTNQVYRVVSEPMLSKSGRRRVMLCGPGGRFSVSAPAESVKWGLMLRNLKRYDLVIMDKVEKREHGVGLVDGSGFKKISELSRK